MPLQAYAPVAHISYYEAEAFARWRQARLPTEQEFEVYLTTYITNYEERRSETFHPNQAGEGAGQLWCWTQSHYSPYPGYKPYAGMLNEYNGKFMSSQFVLRGGCLFTEGSHYRHTYRNFYEPHQRWMFSGIRIAKDMI